MGRGIGRPQRRGLPGMEQRFVRLVVLPQRGRQGDPRSWVRRIEFDGAAERLFGGVEAALEEKSAPKAGPGARVLRIDFGCTAETIDLRSAVAPGWGRFGLQLLEMPLGQRVIGAQFEDSSKVAGRFVVAPLAHQQDGEVGERGNVLRGDGQRLPEHLFGLTRFLHRHQDGAALVEPVRVRRSHVERPLHGRQRFLAAAGVQKHGGGGNRGSRIVRRQPALPGEGLQGPFRVAAAGSLKRQSHGVTGRIFEAFLLGIGPICRRSEIPESLYGLLGLVALAESRQHLSESAEGLWQVRVEIRCETQEGQGAFGLAGSVKEPPVVVGQLPREIG